MSDAPRKRTQKLTPAISRAAKRRSAKGYAVKQMEKRYGRESFCEWWVDEDWRDPPLIDENKELDEDSYA